MSSEQHTLLARYGIYTRANIIALIASQILAWTLIKILTLGLAQTAYGLLSTLTALGSLAGVFFSSFLVNSIWRYAEKFQNEGKGEHLSALLHGTVFIAIILNTIVFGLFLLSFNLFGLNVLGLPDEIMLGAMIATCAFAITTSLYTALVSLAHGLQNVGLILTVSLAYGILQVVGASIVLINSGGALTVLIVNAISLGILFGVILLWILKWLPSPKSTVYIVKQAVLFSGPLAFRTFFTLAVPTCIIYVAFVWTGATLAAIVSIGVSAIALLSESIRAVYTPFRQYAIAELELSKALCRRRVTEASILILELLIIGAFWLFLLSPEIVILLATPQYLEASNFIRFSVLGAAFLWFGYIYGTTGSYLAEKTYMETVSAALGFLALIISIFVLLPTYGLVGLAISYSISCFVTGGMNLIFGRLFFDSLIPTSALPKLGMTLFISSISFLVVSAILSNYLAGGLVATIAFISIQLRIGPLKMEHFGILFPFIVSLKEDSEVEGGSPQY